MIRSGVVRYGLLIVVVLGVGGALLRHQIRDAWPGLSSGGWDGRFQDPEGLAVDEDGNIYVADEDERVLYMLDSGGKTLYRIGRVSGFEGQLTSGDSLIATRPGRVIAISGEHNLVEFEVGPDGTRLVRTIGHRGDGPGLFEDPEGLAMDMEGNLFVTDEDHRRINVFGRDGVYQRSWNVSEEPEAICVSKERVYVSYSKAGWIECFSPSGDVLFHFGRRGSGPGEFKVPDAVRISPDGNELYVTDQKNHRIQVFDLEGQYKRTLGRRGSAPGCFYEPEDLAFDPQGNLVVADGGNHRIQVFDPDGNLLCIIE